MAEAGASCPPDSQNSGTNLEGSDMDPGLAQDQGWSKTVANGLDVNGNSRIMPANVLWNNQYAIFAEEEDGYWWKLALTVKTQSHDSHNFAF